jgi:hypothetical protein
MLRYFHLAMAIDKHFQTFLTPCPSNKRPSSWEVLVVVMLVE